MVPSGLFLAILGVGCLGLYLLLPSFYPVANLLEVGVLLVSLAALPLIFGLALTFQGIRASRRFSLPRPWLLAAGFGLALLAGQLALSFVPSSVAYFLFPPFHILTSLLPALAVPSFVSRRGASSWWLVTLQGSYGALFSPLLALGLEFCALLSIMALVVVLLLLFRPEMAPLLKDLAGLQDPNMLSRVILSPPLLVAGAGIFVVVAPLVEEFIKPLAVPLLSRQLGERAEAFLWGVACGAGFSAAEGLLNGGVALEGWGVVMVMRWGSTLMHALASGLMGLGWYGLLVDRRPGRLLASYGASVGVHALWNGTAVALIALSAWAVLSPDNPLVLIAAGVGSLSLLAFMGLFTLGMVLGIRYFRA